ncbi:VOC family protein [Microbacterium sp. M1A1_1b]|uniref:VOC family protein n=1 Tax=Curtobacterium sp. VKM Ac-2922 TaxID=2929475 RepID=UPI001FB24ABA|nr:VOC family protein [Curtobacterium sp. VKM Ac-2922]MCJ1713894.1 VOC family protein [Curtobacterium sp. VKM Ac-2922]
MDWKIELVMVPVSDVDRARDFYDRIGFTIDHDQRVSDDVRFVQATPPGSACSIAFGDGIMSPDVEPGSLKSIQVVVPDADQALADLRALGVDVVGVDELAWGRFVFFTDPDGNAWTLQQLPPRP